MGEDALLPVWDTALTASDPRRRVGDFHSRAGYNSFAMTTKLLDSGGMKWRNAGSTRRRLWGHVWTMFAPLEFSRIDRDTRPLSPRLSSVEQPRLGRRAVRPSAMSGRFPAPFRRCSTRLKATTGFYGLPRPENRLALAGRRGRRQFLVLFPSFRVISHERRLCGVAAERAGVPEPVDTTGGGRASGPSFAVAACFGPDDLPVVRDYRPRCRLGFSNASR